MHRLTSSTSVKFRNRLPNRKHTHQLFLGNYTVANRTDEIVLYGCRSETFEHLKSTTYRLQLKIPKRRRRRARRWPATQIWQLPTVHTKHSFHTHDNWASFEKTACGHRCCIQAYINHVIFLQRVQCTGDIGETAKSIMHAERFAMRVISMFDYWQGMTVPK